jgi:hypothetical protein
MLYCKHLRKSLKYSMIYWNENKKIHPLYYGKGEKPVIPPLPNEIVLKPKPKAGSTHFEVLGIERETK